MNFHEFSSQSSLNIALCDAIANDLRTAIDQEGVASLAVSGGSTPKGLFELLSVVDLAWDKVIVTLVDERWVEASDDDSNEKLVRSFLLQNKAAAAQFLGLKNAHASASEGVAELDQSLAKLPSRFSAIVLGMGGDGHTASFFPQSPQLSSATDMASGLNCCATEPVTAPHERMTLTLPRILAVQSLYLHFTGEQKKRIFDQALIAGPLSEYPVRSVIHQSAVELEVYWTQE